MSTNASFVASLYRDLLRREPDEEGLRFYASRLDDGRYDRADVVTFFADSPEFASHNGGGRRGRVRRAFACAYGRMPDEGETDRVAGMASRTGAACDRDYLRAAVMAFGRHEYPTSVAVRFVERDLESVPLPHSGMSYALDRGDVSVSHVLIGGASHEAHLHAVFELFVGKGMTAVDVGANVGTHMLKLADLVGDDGRVFAFEPNTENARLLSLTKARNRLDNTVVLPFALSRSVGSAFFSPAIGSNGGFMPDRAATILHPNCSVVPTVPLDLVLADQRVDFIKMDVEGAEHLVLSGALSLLRRCRPVITSEFSLEMLSRVSGVEGAAYLRQIREMGYRVYTLGLGGPVGEIVDIDAAMADWGSFIRIEDLAFVPVEDPRGLPELRQALG